jgi:NADH:ubiquinone oxidoreductase subunit 4 (subunit M)
MTLREGIVLVPLVACIVALALYPGLITTRGEAAVDRSLAAVTPDATPPPEAVAER